jgi:hypothetical protein
MAQEPGKVTSHVAADGVGVPQPSADVEGIRSRIEETRRGMAATIDSIQDRLSPERLVGQAKMRVRHATVDRLKEAADTVRYTASGLAARTADSRALIVDQARRNPVPMALIGLGLGILLVRALTRRG